ncbi:hypothetical protein GCM10018787_10410 [Streptomyces thermodiastaticus]|nr:hypothetical protein GCM10018787_10410 [Streptomyces thermodiastaticus]
MDERSGGGPYRVGDAFDVRTAGGAARHGTGHGPGSGGPRPGPPPATSGIRPDGVMAPLSAG